MNATEFTLLATGPEEADLNDVLNGFDILAEAAIQPIRDQTDDERMRALSDRDMGVSAPQPPSKSRVAIRKAITTACRDHPMLGAALRSARRLGESRGGRLPSIAVSLFDSRQYTAAEQQSIEAALDEAIRGSIQIPSAPVRKPGIRSAKAVKAERDLSRTYASLVSQLIPLGYNMREVASMWRSIRDGQLTFEDEELDDIPIMRAPPKMPKKKAAAEPKATPKAKAKRPTPSFSQRVTQAKVLSPEIKDVGEETGDEADEELESDSPSRVVEESAE